MVIGQWFNPLKALLDNITAGILVVNDTGGIDYINTEASKVLEIDPALPDQMTLKPPRFMLMDEQEEVTSSLWQQVEQCFQHKTSQHYATIGLSVPGQRYPRWVVMNINLLAFDSSHAQMIPELNIDETAKWVILSITDLSALKNRERQMALHAEVFSAAGEAAAITDHRLNVLDINKAYLDITLYEKQEVLHKKIELYKLIRQDREIYRALREQLMERGFWQGELWSVKKNGERHPILLTVSKVEQKTTQVSHFVFVFSDITELKLARERLDFLAYHDQLTYLPNRSMSQLRFQHSTQRASRDGSKVGMLFIDLDDFKIINDSLGHSKGDYLLKQFSIRLKQLVRKQDTVARLGGDEFLVILEDIESEAQLARVCEKILQSLEMPFQLGKFERFINASIGVAMYPDDGESFDELLKNSDAAMYSSKHKAQHGFQFYNSAITEKVHRRSQLENDLRKVLAKKQLQLFYQPQVYLESGQVSGAEALLRWNHPSKEFVSPEEFIPVLESTGLIVSVGRWVARQALMQLKQWREQGLNLPRIAINVSAIQLQKDDLSSFLIETLKELDLTPADLEIEITESVFIDNDVIPKVLQEMHDFGFYLALDDFGTGYSSLSYLTRLPFNKIKLDRTFVNDVQTKASSEAMAKSLIALAKTLGFEVIAEGVEDSQQYAFLNDQGCDEAQGYFIGRPVASEQFIEQIEQFYKLNELKSFKSNQAG